MFCIVCLLTAVAYIELQLYLKNVKSQGNVKHKKALMSNIFI